MYIMITDTNIISTFGFLILSTKKKIFFSIILSIIKGINNVIITKNDIIGTLFTISVTSFRNNRYQYYR